MPAAMTTILALDVGDVRIGVASARFDVRIASPLLTLQHNGHIIERIIQLAKEHDAAALVVGVPRNLNGDETGQTAKVREFIATLRQQLTIPVHEQDEATTSLKAEAELRQRGKAYEKGDIDSLAATYILEDYLEEHSR